MNLLSVNDLSKSEILEVFRIADEIREGKLAGILEGKTLALLFEKPSTRTRVSFEAAMLLLKGNSIYLDAKKLQVSRGETYEDTAKVLGLYADFIAARLYDHDALVRMAKASDAVVINALTDLEHPCQALSDIYSVRDAKGFKGTKIAFIGDIAANTANSLMLAATKLGIEIALVGPETVKPNPGYLKAAKRQGSVYVYSDIKEGFKGADVVYTDTWVSMGEEAEAGKRRKAFSSYQLNKSTLNYAKKDAVVMHCLPAHRGEEITSDVLDGKQSIVWQQAANKLAVEKAILLYLLDKER